MCQFLHLIYSVAFFEVRGISLEKIRAAILPHVRLLFRFIAELLVLRLIEQSYRFSFHIRRIKARMQPVTRPWRLRLGSKQEARTKRSRLTLQFLSSPFAHLLTPLFTFKGSEDNGD